MSFIFSALSFVAEELNLADSYLHRDLVSHSSLCSRHTKSKFLQSLIFKRRYSVVLCPFGVRAEDALLMAN